MVLLWVRGAVSIIQVPMRGSGTKMEIEKEGQKSVESVVLMMQAKQSKQEQFVSPARLWFIVKLRRVLSYATTLSSVVLHLILFAELNFSVYWAFLL